MNVLPDHFLGVRVLFLSLFCCLSSLSAQELSNQILIKIAPEHAGHNGRTILQKIPEKAILKYGLLPARQANKGSRYVILEREELGLNGSYDDQIEALKALGMVIDAEPNYRFDISALPDDPEFDQQWGLKNTGESFGLAGADIHAEGAWDIQTKGEGVVGLLDTGVDFTHPDLVDNIWQNLAEDADGDGRVLEFIDGRWRLDPDDLDDIDADSNGYVDDLIGWDFVNNDNNPFDDNGHGTHVAGIIGARGNNGIGISGVAWEARIMPLKTFGRNGSGSLSDILRALAYAREMGADLTNNSWGGRRYSRFLQQSIERARAEGQIVVAAAGNGGYFNPYSPYYPASYNLENIISVCASTELDEIAGFSSFGSRNVDLAAPGRRIYSTLPGGEYGTKSGTSMACGFVSGALLLLKAQYPAADMEELIANILLNVDHAPDLLGKSKSGGRLNLLKSLQGSSGNTSTNGLFAAFLGPESACVNTPLTFTNTSIINNLSQTQVLWYINDRIASNSFDLDYSFNTPGWYEVKLVLRQNGVSEELVRPIEITSQASSINLGPDTSICADAYVLSTNSNFHEIRWLKVNCPDGNDCMGDEDFTTLDSLSFRPIGGNISNFGSHFLLTDTQNKILDIAARPVFSPRAAGTYRLHPVYHWQEIVPTGMEPGNDVSGIDLGIDTCGQVLSAHEFKVFEAELLSTQSIARITASGLYRVEIVDACGNRASDMVRIDLTTGCVWPGDINNDGLVSMIDFLSLGIANGNTGPARPNASSDWIGQPAEDWATSFGEENVLAPQLNHKYADANGDGSIDLQADKQIVADGIAFFQQLEVPDGAGEEISFSIKHMNTVYSENRDTARIDFGIYVESADGSPLTNLYGLAFDLNFSNQVLEKPSIMLDPNWSGELESLSFLADSSNTSLDPQWFRFRRRKAGIGMVSRNRNPYVGQGLLACGGVIVVIDDISGETDKNGISNFTISSDNLLAIDPEGRPISSNRISTNTTLSIDLNWLVPDCESAGLADSDEDGFCDAFDLCPGYNDVLYPNEGLLMLNYGEQGFVLDRIYLNSNRIFAKDLSPSFLQEDIVAFAHESDSSYLAMIDDGVGTLANYRLRLNPNGSLTPTLLNADNRFTSSAFVQQILGMAGLNDNTYLIAFGRSEKVELITVRLNESGTFGNFSIRSFDSGLPANTLGIARKGEDLYHILVDEGGRLPVNYEASLDRSSWTFTLSAVEAKSFLRQGVQDLAYVGGNTCPACEEDCPPQFQASVFLEGPYEPGTGLMRNTYQSSNLLELTDPYGLNTTMDQRLLNRRDSSALVDWVKVELRDPADPSQIIAEKAVLLQRDGKLLDREGSWNIRFEDLEESLVYVVLKHRSHLGIMTADLVDLDSNPYLDFSSSAMSVYSAGDTPRKNFNGLELMWCGDADGDGNINSRDKNAHWRKQNGERHIPGTTTADFNMDGVINAVDLNEYWRKNNSKISQIP